MRKIPSAKQEPITWCNFEVPSMNATARKPRSAVRFLAGWCGLLLYLGAFSPLGVGLATLVGSFDPNHQTLVQAGMGGTRLVLHHEQKCTTHHHGFAARTLTLFAEPVRAGQPDHVLQFRAATMISHPTQLSAPAPTTYQPPVAALIQMIARSPNDDSPALVPTHPPPHPSGQPLCRRSTVLLI